MDKDLRRLLKSYALVGIAQWNDQTDEATKEIARVALAYRIAEGEYEAVAIIDSKLKRGGDPRALFIPMPIVNHSGILACFFLPMPEAERMAFDLVLIIDAEHSLGFRFEPAEEAESTHGYGHVQMNRTMFHRTIEVKGIPQWLPDSYPACPQRASHPLQLFLSMTTSVHGYEKGMKQIILDLFANEPITAKKYLNALEAAVM